MTEDAINATETTSRDVARSIPDAETVVDIVVRVLDDGKAEDLITIDLRTKSSIADYMVIASGRSARQVSALTEQVTTELKMRGCGRLPVEGKEHGDWALIDAGDVIVHVFRPEVRQYYNLEKMWADPPMPRGVSDPE